MFVTRKIGDFDSLMVQQGLPFLFLHACIITLVARSPIEWIDETTFSGLEEVHFVKDYLNARQQILPTHFNVPVRCYESERIQTFFANKKNVHF